MARPATGRKFIEAAKEQIASTKSADALRAAQALLLPLEFGLSLEQTAAAIGLSKSRTGKLRTRFQRIKTGAEQPKTKKGLRNHALMTLDEETKFLAPFIDKARNAGIIIVPPLKAGLERHLGRPVAISRVYRLLQRHGWRKLAPDKQHPQSDPVAQEEWGEKTPRRNQSSDISLQKRSTPEAHVPGRGSFWTDFRYSPLWRPKPMRPMAKSHGHSRVHLCLCRRLASRRHARFADFLRPIISGRARQRQHLTLPGNRQIMHTVYHLFALSNPPLLSAPLGKSISSACCPSFACSTLRSGPSSFLAAARVNLMLLCNLDQGFIPAQRHPRHFRLDFSCFF
jgi:transposase